MRKFGLKLWSTNENYVEEAVRLYKKGVYHYIELFAVPHSFEKYIDLWAGLKIPYVIHAPHSLTGLNLARAECYEQNLVLSKEAFAYAKILNAKFVIFHPGINGDIKQTAKQMNMILSKCNIDPLAVLIENKPYYGIKDGIICNGSSPDEIEFVIKESGIGFCLDIGHAIYSANAKVIDSFKSLNSFMNLRPKMFHLSDGDFKGVYDEHEHLGKGTFELDKIIYMLPYYCYVAIETKKLCQDSLNDFEIDVKILIELSEYGEKSYCNCNNKILEY